MHINIHHCPSLSVGGCVGRRGVRRGCDPARRPLFPAQSGIAGPIWKTRITRSSRHRTVRSRAERDRWVSQGIYLGSERLCRCCSSEKAAKKGGHAETQHGKEIRRCPEPTLKNERAPHCPSSFLTEALGDQKNQSWAGELAREAYREATPPSGGKRACFDVAPLSRPFALLSDTRNLL